MTTAKKVYVDDTESTWAQIIDSAEYLGGFSKIEVDLSEDWRACACHNVPDDARFDGRGAPKDTLLFKWGIAFAEAIDTDDFDNARYYDERIRERIEKLYGEGVDDDTYE